MLALVQVLGFVGREANVRETVEPIGTKTDAQIYRLL